MICIITVYKSINFGSYLQAKALRDLLLKYDDEVVFLDGNFRPWIYRSQVRFILSRLVHLDFKQALYSAYRIIHNYLLWKQLPSISLNKVRNKRNVTYVLGSDEIWNLARTECQNPLFWADGLEGKIISFSPSINTATKDMFISSPYVSQSLSKMSAISVRDFYSRKVLGSITKTPITITLDPTLMFGYDYYKRPSFKEMNFNYIALYAFTDVLNERDISNIRRFAKEHNLKIISLAQTTDWCDINIRISNDVPFIYYMNAQYVITNTFHGTAFAINFKRNFLSLASNQKVYELLEQFELTHRIATNNNYEEFKEKMLCAEDIQDKVTLKIQNLRQLSYEYLEKALTNI